MATIPRLARQDLAMYAGDGATWRATITDASGAAWSLSGWSATFVATRPDGSSLCDLSIGSGMVVADAAGGLLDVTIPPIATDAIAAQEVCPYRMVIVRGAQGPFTVASGTLTVRP